MSDYLTPEQRTGALIAALNWVGAYEGHGGTIESGATDVPQDMLDAYVLLSGMVSNAVRAETRAAYTALIERNHPEAGAEQKRRAAANLAAEAVPARRIRRIMSTDAD